MQDLCDVTICAADTLQPELAARAIKKSMEHCRFGDAILFTDQRVKTNARIVRIPPIKSRMQYNEFIFKKLHRHIRTQWVLIVQWDGYIVEPSCWKREFLDYDYIGARWPDGTEGSSVGNGGFSLRSQRLQELIATEAFPWRQDFNEDELIGRLYRPVLETLHGIRFAPEHVANQFSYECHVPDAPTFGFHGVFNIFRHMNDSQMEAFIARIGRNTAGNLMLDPLLCNLYFRNRLINVDSLYKKMRLRRTASDIEKSMLTIGYPPAEASAIVNQRERWLKFGA